MTLAKYFEMANVPYAVQSPIDTVEVVEQENVCRFSFFPWLRSEIGMKNINRLSEELVSFNLIASECIINVVRINSPSIYELTLEKK